MFLFSSFIVLKIIFEVVHGCYVLLSISLVVCIFNLIFSCCLTMILLFLFQLAARTCCYIQENW